MSVMILGSKKCDWGHAALWHESQKRWFRGRDIFSTPVFQAGVFVDRKHSVVDGYTLYKYGKLDADLLVALQCHGDNFKVRSGLIHGIWSLRSTGRGTLALMPVMDPARWQRLDEPYREDLAVAIGCT